MPLTVVVNTMVVLFVIILLLCPIKTNAWTENSENKVYTPLCYTWNIEYYGQPGFELYTVPIDLYAVTAPVPDLRRIMDKEIPIMTDYYTALPSNWTDHVSFFGFYEKPNANFTIVFGEASNDVNFYLYVEDGYMVIPSLADNNFNDDRIRLPEDFGISINFRIDGVQVKLLDMFDDKQPSVMYNSCTTYRAIPTAISYMAVFTDCDSITIEMINVMAFKKFIDPRTHQVFDASKNIQSGTYFTLYRFPNELSGYVTPQVLTGRVLQSSSFEKRAEFILYGTMLKEYGTNLPKSDDIIFLCNSFNICHIVQPYIDQLH